ARGQALPDWVLPRYATYMDVLVPSQTGCRKRGLTNVSLRLVVAGAWRRRSDLPPIRESYKIVQCTAGTMLIITAFDT
ncbi:MAG: hypothetical protein D6767_01360, partial [Candidatus Hydrogenedentota bacterium]